MEENKNLKEFLEKYNALSKLYGFEVYPVLDLRVRSTEPVVDKVEPVKEDASQEIVTEE